MSSSTDSLKKKVCVTVFLDELFEDVEEEEEEEGKEEKERKDTKQVSEVTESAGKFAEKSLKGPSRVNSDNDVKVNAPSNADTKHSQTQLRPRKHRKESKFSKNSNDSFKNELSKYGYGSCFKVKNEGCEPVDSAVSDSDFDLDEFLGLDKWTAEKSKSSFMELSECDLSEDFFMSRHPEISSGKISSPKTKRNSKRKSNAYIEARVELCNKSTQFEGTNHERKSSKEGVVEEILFKQESPEKVEEDVLAWEKTQRQIQLILAEARNRYQEKEACEGDRIRHYDLRSILEECAKTRSSRSENDAAATLEDESDEQEVSDSYTCVFPHRKQNLRNRPVEVKRVWTSERKSAWNDGFESDLSETDCANYEKDFGLLPIQNDSMICYTVCLKREDSESEKAEKKRELFLRKLAASQSSSRLVCSESSVESIESKTSRAPTLVFQAVTHLGDRAILGTVLKAEEEAGEEERRNEGDLAEEALKSSWRVKERNKNFADGDTIKKLVSRDSRFILDLEAKENLFVCDEILKRVGEPKVIRNEIIVNRAEIKLHPRDEADKRHPSLPTTTASDALAEVFFNQKQTESLEKNITDAESEMVFADSEDYFCRKYSIGPVPSLSTPRHPLQDICVIEFEDKLSRSKILRRMKTVEILGDSSLNNMKNISTEVILICENISSNEVCMEAWQSSASNIRSISEMKQCYLKDSNDSAMYLIEIPLHFTRTKKERLSDSDHFCKASDSD